MIGNEVGARWYSAGLHFECQGCGRCCSGPGEGYIWVTGPEIELIARHLAMVVDEVRQKYLRRVALRTTIIEHEITKDCIFLKRADGKKRCAIYPVRPSQCRAWPFWPENLADPYAWNVAAGRCPGMNRGRYYDMSQIDSIKKDERWWEYPTNTTESSTK